MIRQIIILFSLPGSLLSAPITDSLPAVPPKKMKLELTGDFFTVASAIDTRNLLEGLEPNNIHFYYSVNLNNRIRFKKFKLSSYFFNEYGIRYYFDSITSISEDIFNLKNSLSFPLPLWKRNFDFN